MIKEDKDFCVETKIAIDLYYIDKIIDSQGLRKILMKLTDKLSDNEAKERNQKLIKNKEHE